MDLHEKINENTILYYIESNNTSYDANNKPRIDSYTLSFGFYDCHYYLTVSKKDIEEDNCYSTSLDGDSRLFDSFEEHCQDELWEIIKTKCKEYDKWYNKNMI
jgi:hypothetical protein